MSANLTGTLLGRYQLQGRIGSGGMGDVYQATDTTLDRPVAVKVLHAQLADDPTFSQRFEREAKTIAALNHPGIVQVYDYGFDAEQERYCIVLEYLPDGTLEDVMVELTKVSTEERLTAVRRNYLPLVKAVAYAHEKGMIHRDIKPGNILIKSGNPVLADFGLARIVDASRLTAEGTSTGTPSYMSPEQGSGQESDHRSDIYALGVILYEMVAGMLPFKSETPIGVIIKHINDPLPDIQSLIKDVPRGLDMVLLKAMAKRPADRYQSADSLLGAVTAVLDGKELPVELESMADTIILPSPVPASESLPPESDTHDHQHSKNAIPTWAYPLGIALLVLIGIALSQSGAFSAATPEPTAQPTLEPTAGIPSMAGPVDVFDDFSDSTSGWPEEDSGPIQYTYEDDMYRIVNTLPGQARVVNFDTDYTFTSLFSEVDVILADGQPESGYGLVFRWVDSSHFYVFAINGVGQVSIWALEDAAWRELRGESENWTDSDAVLTDGSPNTLTLIADGGHFVGMVNHVKVIEIDDDTYDEGAVGFYIATSLSALENPLADVLFDNFIALPSIPAMTP